MRSVHIAFVALAAAALLAAACSDGTVNGIDKDGGAKDASGRPDVGPVDSCKNKLDCGANEDCVGGKCVPEAPDAGGDGGGDPDDTDGGVKICTLDNQCQIGWKCSSITKTCARPAGKLTVDLLDFGNAVFGSPETVSTEVENIGTVDLVVLDFSFDATTDKAAFTLPGDLLAKKPYRLQPGEKLEIAVTFTVIDASAKTGKLQVTTDADPSLLDAVLKTSFKGSADFAIVDDTDKTIWPDTGNPGSTYNLDFKQVGVGQSGTIAFTVMNKTSGNAPLAISGVAVNLAPTYYTAKLIQFSDKTTELTPPVYLNPAEKVIVSITFAPPTKNNSVPGTLELSTNDPDVDNSGAGDNGRAIIALKGVAGFPPGISVSGNKLDFGEVQIGTAPAPSKTITVTNTADQTSGFPLSVTVSLALGSETSFTFDPASLIVQPGDSKDVKVTFNPVTTGAKINELNLANDDPDADPAKHPLKIALNGKGVNPNLAIDPPVSVLDFGDVGVGQTVQQVVTLVNTGDGSLDVHGASAPLPFVMTPEKALPVTLSPAGTAGNTVKLTIRFTPPAATNYEHSLVVTSTDLDNLTVTLNLKGSGVQPLAQYNPTDTVDFGKVPMGSTSTEKTVTINNVGQGNLVLGDISLVQTNSRFSITSAPNPLPYSIAAGTNVTVKMVYKPDAAVVEDPGANYLVVKSNDPNTAEKHIGLTGEGLNTADPTAVILTSGTDLAGTVHNNADLDSVTLDLTKGHQISLDGKTASHPNGGAVITDYTWSLTVRPAGSAAAIATTGDPWRVQFTPDKPGNYQVTLVVKDGNAKSSPADTLSIKAFANDTLGIEMSWDGRRKGYLDCTQGSWICTDLGWPFGSADERLAMLALTGPSTCDGSSPTPNWGTEGTPTWSAFCTNNGDWLEPQIVTYANGERSDVLRTYGVAVSYLDDRNNCYDSVNGVYVCSKCTHDSTVAHVTIKVNGGIVGGGTINKTLQQQGAVANIADITRQYGAFIVTPAP